MSFLGILEVIYRLEFQVTWRAFNPPVGKNHRKFALDMCVIDAFPPEDMKPHEMGSEMEISYDIIVEFPNG